MTEKNDNITYKYFKAKYDKPRFQTEKTHKTRNYFFKK